MAWVKDAVAGAGVAIFMAWSFALAQLIQAVLS